MKKLFFFCLVLCVILASPVFGSDDVEFSPCPEGIFGDALRSEVAPLANTAANDAKVIRARAVRVDFDRILGRANGGKRADVVTLNMFHDANFVIRIDRVQANRTGNSTWFGTLMGKDKGTAIFTMASGIMVGSVKTGNQNFGIRYLGDGIHEVQELDHSKFGDCLAPNSSNPIPTHSHDGLSGVTADPASALDVMVVYTADARSAAGGTAAMVALINQAVSESNTGYTNSNVSINMTLVHTAEVVYSESGFNWSTCISRLQGKTDGYMDNVHSLRDAHCADVVLMVVNNGSYCGLASTIMATESSAFALASRSCITGYYSFAHEIGHLQGARHDRYVDGTENSPYAYNHGHTYPPNQWRTIMAYNNACPSGCTRVNHWSNPDINYMGTPTGANGGVGVGEDNARTLDNTAYTVANFRDSSGGCTPPPASYCTSSGNNQNYEYIAGVQVGGINNSSGASGYTDFTGISTNITRGNSVSVNLTPGFVSSSYTEAWEIYIDYNNDKDFDDAGEKVFTGSGSSNVTGSFTVATGATTGTTRMRVNMKYSSYVGSPCGTFTYGEVEDYTVNIQ